MAEDFQGNDQRKNLRITKSLTVTYCLKSAPDQSDTSTLKDISQGGICFTTATHFPEESTLIIQLFVSYLAPHRIMFEVEVIGIKALSKLVYEVRAKFKDLHPGQKEVLAVIEENYRKGASERYGSN